MAKIKPISPEDFRRMQLLQCGMLCELDRVCRENGIRYSIFAGTLLGAVRHQGYIPWDDDADVVMLREDYEKFKKVAHQLDGEICFFQDHETDPEYRWGYGKLRRTGTRFIRAGQEHMKGKTGVFIDIFPLDDIPLSVPAQMLHDLYCFCLRKILYAEVGRLSKEESRWMRGVYSLLARISPDAVYKRVARLQRKSANASPNRVRTLLFPAFGKLYHQHHPQSIRYGMPKEWFLELAEYEFEGKRFFGTKDFNAILTYFYGDYMTLPPEDQREPHAPVSDYEF